MSAEVTLALSVRQPWAWACIHGGKDIENRDWSLTSAHVRRARELAARCERIMIHASVGMTRVEYSNARGVIAPRLPPGIAIPERGELARGGIIGTVELVDVVTESDSPWFIDERVGLVLRKPHVLPFVPCRGCIAPMFFRPPFVGDNPMTVRLGNEEFPGGVLTMPWDEVHRVFLARVRERPLQGEDSTTIIEVWTCELQWLRGEKQSSPRRGPKKRRRR